MLSSFSFHSPSPALALLASEPARAFVDLVASRAPRAAPAIGDGHPPIVERWAGNRQHPFGGVGDHL